MITLVVFSKDRAMQLDSLLRSVKDHCTGIDSIDVLALASTGEHVDAYEQLSAELQEDWPDLIVRVVDTLIEPEPLGQQLYDVLAETPLAGHIALAVDDQLFYRPSDFAFARDRLDDNEAFAWSWRLGDRSPGITTQRYWCDLEYYWLVPALSSDPDYGYLWHSDGSLYRTADYTKLLDRFLSDWRTGAYTPNDLEAAVAGRKREWAAAVGPHLGPLEPTCITWQLNRVQAKYGSPAAEISETNTDALAKAYLEGKRVDNDALYGALCANPTRWNPPGARPTHVYACEEASRFWAACVR